MELQIIFLGFFLLLVNGARIQRDAEDDCAHPPSNTENVRCCEMPRRHLWGKIRKTIHYCAEKMRETTGEVEEEEEVPPTPAFPGKGQGHRKRYSFRKNFHDGCFLECMFEKEGFLIDNAVNKEAVLERIRATQEGEEEWQATATAAVEKCVTDDIEINANETCTSGSAEVVRCVFKEMFMECPTWLEDNEYCNSLKEFYVRCPNGPPPEVFFKRRHHNRRHSPNVEEPEPESEPEPEPQVEEAEAEKTDQEQ